MKYLHARRAGARRLSAGAHAQGAERCRRPSSQSFAKLPRGHARPRAVHDDGLRAHARAAAEGPSARQAHRADRRRRGAHLRHAVLFRQVGIYSPVGQLYEPEDKDELLVLQGSEGRPDPRGRHQRGGRALLVDRGGDELQRARRADAAVLHLLLDVRLPARRRPDLGGGRLALAAASCSARPRAAPRCRAKACSTRTARATCWPPPFPTASPTIPASPTSSR